MFMSDIRILKISSTNLDSEGVLTYNRGDSRLTNIKMATNATLRRKLYYEFGLIQFHTL